jgi:hypothetical protein
MSFSGTLNRELGNFISLSNYPDALRYALGIAVFAIIDYSLRLMEVDELWCNFVRTLLYFIGLFLIIQNKLTTASTPYRLLSIIGLMVVLCAFLSFISEMELYMNMVFIIKFVALIIMFFSKVVK